MINGDNSTKNNQRILTNGRSLTNHVVPSEKKSKATKA